MQIEERYIRRGEVVVMTALSANTISRMEHKGTFPGRFKLGENSVAWKLSEVTAWMESRRRPVTPANSKVA